MAQDVQKYAAKLTENQTAHIRIAFELVPYLIKAIQELNQKIENWKA